MRPDATIYKIKTKRKMSEVNIRLSADSQQAMHDVDERIRQILRKRAMMHQKQSAQQRQQTAPLPAMSSSDTSYRSLVMRPTRADSNPGYFSADGALAFYHQYENQYNVKRKKRVPYESALLGWPMPGENVILVANDTTKQRYRAFVEYVSTTDGSHSGIVRLNDFVLIQ